IPSATHEAACGAEFQVRWSSTVPMQESTPLTSAAPLSSDLRDFPGAVGTAPDYPFGGDSVRCLTFQKFITRSRSFCLRVSGAVAPSAYALWASADGSAGSARAYVSREGSCAGHSCNASGGQGCCRAS